MRHGIVTETADVSTETLRLMSILAVVNGTLAALGVAIAYYVYFYVPHPLEVHYTGKYGEVVSSTATYTFVFPVFQVWMFVVLVVGRWRATRPHSLDNLELCKHFPRRASKEQASRVASFGIVAIELVLLVATAYRAVVVATQVG
jgi:hypothetical protein